VAAGVVNADADAIRAAGARHLGPASRPEAFTAWQPGLPEPHVELLAGLNGFTLFHGAFRMLGLRAEPSLDLRAWNDPDTWRFAWGGVADGFVVFGETGWGDQYAYRASQDGLLEPAVYFLEATTLDSWPIAASFPEFVHDELLRNAEQPYDEMTVAAVRRLGDLPPEEHWVLSPSLALGGPESVENVMRMPAVTAMTVAGDLVTAIRAAPGRRVTSVSPWRDDRGRARLAVELD
jgi:hypothetical protein